jgi:hypothetical protein
VAATAEVEGFMEVAEVEASMGAGADFTAEEASVGFAAEPAVFTGVTSVAFTAVAFMAADFTAVAFTAVASAGFAVALSMVDLASQVTATD